MLKECKYSLSKPLKMFWKISFNTGKIPAGYKNQTTIPLHKKGSKTYPQNFRPISLTSHIIKIMERILRKHITEHLERYNLINESQHGFRHNHSCCTQLLSHIDFIFSNSIEGSEVDCVYIDYAKAFNKVDHGLLIKKLGCYGLTDSFINWISNFFKDRSQAVLGKELTLGKSFI